MTGVLGPASWIVLAAVVEQAADAAVAVAGQDHVADLERAVLHEHGRDRAEARIDPRLR